jgi:hypothetical protein
MSDADLVPRWMTADDWPAVEAGFAHSFRDCRASPVWDWRFRRSDSSGWRGVVVNAPDGSIAAFVGGTCLPAWVNGRAATIILSGDNYSAPSWRGMATGRNGLFARAARLFFDALPGDVAACVGVANARRVRLTERLGVNRACESAHWYRWVPSTGAGNTGLSCVTMPCDFATCVAEWDQLWEKRRAVQRAGLIRNGAFLIWRFAARQGREYWCFALRSIFSPGAMGYIVLTPYGEDAAILVDSVLPPQPQAARDAWGQVAAWLLRRGIVRVSTLMSAACPEIALASALGFQPTSPPLDVLPAFRSYPAWLSPSNFEKDYAFTLADSDLF